MSENLSLDLNLRENCETAATGADEIYSLAANMGGMGFIEHNKALCMLSVLINTHMLQAALGAWVQESFSIRRRGLPCITRTGRRRLKRHR